MRPVEILFRAMTVGTRANPKTRTVALVRLKPAGGFHSITVATARAALKTGTYNGRPVVELRPE